jgi:hypothetical protein
MKDGNELDEFGKTVSVVEHGKLIMVGSGNIDVDGKIDQGALVLFEEEEKEEGKKWRQKQKLVASDGTKNDHFGFSMSISGTFMVVGAPGVSLQDKPNQGVVYCFIRNEESGMWTEIQKIVAKDGFSEDRFGFSVAISEQQHEKEERKTLKNSNTFIIAVGSPFRGTSDKLNQGSVYLFMLEQKMNEKKKLVIVSEYTNNKN